MTAPPEVSRMLAVLAAFDPRHRTGGNVHLGVRDGLAVVYVDAMRTRMRRPISSRVGDRWPLHATGTGLVLLAHAGHELQEEVLCGPLARFSEHTITDADELRRALAEIRRAGIAVAHGQISPFHTVVAAPVLDAEDTVCAAISVVVETGRLRPAIARGAPAA